MRRTPATRAGTAAITSDDGSRLTIGDQTIAVNDGTHTATSATGMIRLEPGFYPLTLAYFESTGGQTLRVAVSGPGMPNRELPPEWLFHTP